MTARVHFFDEWAGESLFLKADGQTRWTRAHTWCSRVFSSTCTKYGLDTCGRDIPDKLSVPQRRLLRTARARSRILLFDVLTSISFPFKQRVLSKYFQPFIK